MYVEGKQPTFGFEAGAQGREVLVGDEDQSGVVPGQSSELVLTEIRLNAKEIQGEKDRLRAERQKIEDALYLYQMNVWSETTKELRRLIQELFSCLSQSAQKRIKEISPGVELGPPEHKTSHDNNRCSEYSSLLWRINQNDVSFMRPWEEFNPFSQVRKFFSQAYALSKEYNRLASGYVAKKKALCNRQVEVIDEALRLHNIRLRQLEHANQ